MSKADKEELEELRASNVLVTTNAKEIGKFLSMRGNKVVFSTYISLMKVAAPVDQFKCVFDLGIFDEAHHIAGHIEKGATVALKDSVVPIKKRVFLTANQVRPLPTTWENIVGLFKFGHEVVENKEDVNLFSTVHYKEVDQVCYQPHKL